MADEYELMRKLLQDQAFSRAIPQACFATRNRDEGPPKMAPKDDKAARQLFRKEDAAKAISEYEKEQKHFTDNRERLKAERQAREEAAARAAKEAPLRRGRSDDASKRSYIALGVAVWISSSRT